MSRLKVAVVGVGALGRHHARILSQLDSAELVGVADTRPEIGQKVASDCKTQWVSNFHDLLTSVDAVSIAVPTTAHLSVAAEFLERQIPTLVEKPLASNVQDAKKLVDLAQRNQTILQVGHVERFNPATEVAWKLCTTPKYIRAERLSPYAFRSTDIGVVHDLMIHDLDLILDLVKSPVCGVEAFGISIIGRHEDSVQARLKFENGCIADVSASRVNPSASRSMQIWSPQETVTVDFTSREVICYRRSEKLLFGTPLLERAQQPDADVEQLKKDIFGTYLKVSKPPVPAADALTAELASFVECVANDRRPLVDGPQALAAMQLAEQVLDSVAAHQWDGNATGAIGPFPKAAAPRKLAG